MRFPHAAIAGRDFARSLAGRRPLFVLVIASTQTALVPGISAAGVTPELIPFTSAADAEILIHGAPRCIPGIPSNPLGPPGPSIIARAALQLAGVDSLIVDAGSFIEPEVPCIRLGANPGGLISDGNAVPGANELFRQGLELGKDLAAAHEYLVIGESVPGGTTTALAVLLALGLDAEGRVSSSLAGNAHALKNQLARAGLAHLPPNLAQDPLLAVEAVGDPMQPVVAGLAMGAIATGCSVLLAGGSQMAAVLALTREMTRCHHATPLPGNIAIGTTRWVVNDPTSDLVGLVADICPCPILVTPLSFHQSQFHQLRGYEDFLVKEGVGAGGAAIAGALFTDTRVEELRQRVEEIYADLLGAEADDREN